MVIPPNAAYVSRDGLVTFDENGRKLDSLGNVAWADTQTLKGADARPLERPAAPPPPPQAQRAAAAVAPPLTPQRFFPEVAPPSTALGMPQGYETKPGMTGYRKPYGTPPGPGPAQPGQGGGGNSWESQVYMPGYQGQGIATETGGRRIGPSAQPQSGQGGNPYNTPPGYSPPTTPFYANPNAGQPPGVDPWTVAPGAPYFPQGAGGFSGPQPAPLGGAYVRPGAFLAGASRELGSTLAGASAGMGATLTNAADVGSAPGYSAPYQYSGPSTTDTSSWQAPQPGVDPWAVAPGAPYTPPNAGGYPDNIKAEGQRSAPRFDDGTQWGYTSPQQPPGPVGPGPVGGREYWERGGRSPLERGTDMMQFKYDEVRPRNPLIGQSPNQGYGPSSPMQGTQPFQGYAPPQNPMAGQVPFQGYGQSSPMQGAQPFQGYAPPQNPLSGQQPGQGYGPPPGGREYWERGGFNPIESGMNMMQYQYDERRPRNPLIGLPPFYGYGG